MDQEPLRTYLRMFRRRTGLSQEDVGFLLGSMCGSSVSRYEQGARLPTLSIALGYALILEVEVPQLYEGLLSEVRTRVRDRAASLQRSLERKLRTAERDRKIALLKKLLVDDAYEGRRN